MQLGFQTLNVGYFQSTVGEQLSSLDCHPLKIFANSHFSNEYLLGILQFVSGQFAGGEEDWIF